MTLTPEEAHGLGIAGATLLELANDHALWADFRADRAGEGPRRGERPQPRRAEGRE